MGKRTTERFLKIHKVSASPYVLLSNLYASENMWDGVAEARKQLKDSLMKKEPGHSLIEVKGTAEKFTVGRISHPRTEEIVGVLRILSFAEHRVVLLTGFKIESERFSMIAYLLDFSIDIQGSAQEVMIKVVSPLI
ncbi:hypothetical protein L1987_54516 [Smallanthus sonchifolius]|uniref:Uncharacterized protein n=1 Tax=Smallanthus sonchifolius TaxID=185202 RepID=A0ACB9E7B3_9ASTR|nr:hypothetical protein L1987_54516 [Smallanthus sonchifolius]